MHPFLVCLHRSQLFDGLLVSDLHYIRSPAEPLFWNFFITMKFNFSLLLLAGYSAAAVIPLSDQPEPAAEAAVEKKDLLSLIAPLFHVSNPGKSRYIVVYKDDASEESKNELSDWISQRISAKRDGSIDSLNFFGFNSLSGYLGIFDDDILGSIRNNTAVKYVEEDAKVSALSLTRRSNSEWGFVRISHRKNAANGNYLHDDEGGKGVTAYVVDTGVKYDDSEFEGRASFGTSIALPNEKRDPLGHGTHVAGTIGSKSFGVAKKVNIVSVNVFDANDDAYVSDMLKGFDWVIKDHNKNKDKSGFKGSTLNMSIGGAKSSAWTDGINALLKAGIHAVVAAGNENTDACNYSPGLSDAIVVAGSDEDDNNYSSSNYGKCVDIIAPGVNIGSVGVKLSPYYMTGTSMASPHVCGTVSYLLSLYPGKGSEYSSSASPSDIKKMLINYGTRDKISGFNSDTPNVLAYQGGMNPSSFWN